MTGDRAQGLTPCLLDQVYPFHLVLDPQLTIRQVGSSLRRLCPGTVPGTGLGSVIEVVTPQGPITWQTLKSRPRALFVLQMRHSLVRLRGQMLHDQDSDVVIFVGSPWITEMDALTDLNLTLEDFSVSDNIVDYLLLLQTQGAALAQARTLAESLQQNAQELRARTRRLERLAGELQSVLNSASEGIYGVDVSGVITFINEAGVRLLGKPRADIVGRKVDDVIGSEPMALTPGSKGEVTAAGEPGQAVIGRHRRADGSWFDSELSSGPILENGQRVGEVVVFRDISERRAVDRMKDEFISMVSHELRTPLTSIRGALGLLGSGSIGELSPPAARMVEVATVSTDRLIRLISDMLEVERMTVRQVVINRRPTGVRSLIQSAVAEMTGLAQASGVQIRIGPTEGLVLADPDRIVQTLANLLGNAIKFSGAGATVEVRATTVGDQVRFDVSDSGPGIPPDQLEVIFEPFRQADGSDTRSQGGSGLGLAICRGLVESHGGRIWASSRLGDGATLSFLIPRAEQAAIR